MLVNCPRCGFSQPNDQYCAQCGIDMQSFKQKKQPLVKLLLDNAGVQVGILLIAAVLVGQYIFHSQEPQKWVQKITHFQGISTSKKTLDTNDGTSANSSHLEQTSEENENSSSLTGSLTDSLAGTPPESSRQELGANQAKAMPAAINTNSIGFKVTYAEVSLDMLSRWVAASTDLGLYQNLTDYSAGIIYDFKKREDKLQQTLKSVDIKLSPGSTDSSLSGLISPDGNQIIGLIIAIEYKSSENEIIYGTVNVTRSNLQSSETYPAEFALAKGAAFFIVGALKRENFAAEQVQLNMPPFQIYKSSDFMTRKTEFVIIVEPDYK